MKENPTRTPSGTHDEAREAEGNSTAHPPGFSPIASGADALRPDTRRQGAGITDPAAVVQRSDFPRRGVVQQINASIASTTMTTADGTVEIPAGTILTLLAQEGSNYRVEYHGQEGLVPITDVDDPTTSEIERNMEGRQMTWRPSSPGVLDLRPYRQEATPFAAYDNRVPTDFAAWALAPTQGQAPAVDRVTVINCWEMILLAAFRAGVLSWSRINTIYRSRVPQSTIDKLANPDPAIRREGSSEIGPFIDGLLISLMTTGTLRSYDVANRTPPPRRGDVVFFNRAAHVTLAVGSGDDIHTFWPPPNTAFSPGAGGTVDAVKRSTITELYNWMDGNRAALQMGPMDPINVEVGTPAW
jgi:hypothetical protein